MPGKVKRICQQLLTYQRVELTDVECCENTRTLLFDRIEPRHNIRRAFPLLDIQLLPQRCIDLVEEAFAY